MPNYLARYRFKKLIRKVIRDNKFANAKSSLAYYKDEARSSGDRYWQRLPTKTVGKWYKRKKRYYKNIKKGHWIFDGQDWVLKNY